MLEILWRRHYRPGTYGGYHADMARAFEDMLADPDCDPKTARRLHSTIRIHKLVEAHPNFQDPKIFTQVFTKQYG